MMIILLFRILLLLTVCLHVSSSPVIGSKRPPENEHDDHSPRQKMRNDKRKIIAIGELDGDLNITHHILMVNGVVDAHNKWIAKDVVVVQLV
jgi:hypothetical protein